MMRTNLCLKYGVTKIVYRQLYILCMYVCNLHVRHLAEIYNKYKFQERRRDGHAKNYRN